MTKPAHAPGPWKADDYNPPYATNVRAQNGMYSVCICGSAYNARLIAAAPDMLEALENLENDDGSIPDHAWKMVEAAISKATLPSTPIEGGE